MLFLRGRSIETRKIFLDFFRRLGEKEGNKLRTLQYKEMGEGFHASPGGLSQLVFITNPIKASRTSRNIIMTLEKEDHKNVYIKIIPTNKTLKLSKKLVKPALKTITSMSKLDITKNHDYIIVDEFKRHKDIIVLSKWKGPFKWSFAKKKLKNKSTFFAIQHRIRMNSPNTNLVGIYCDIPFYTTHAFNIFKADKKESKILTLLFNSIIGLSQLSSLSKETTEGFMEFMQSDLIKLKVLDLKNLAKPEVDKLLKLFERLRSIEFPSILEQLENRFRSRLELDKTILKIIGFTDKEINEWLPRLYDALIMELKSTEF